MPDYILHDSLECAHLPPDYIPDYHLARYSEDNILNFYGRKIYTEFVQRVGLDKRIGK